MQKEQQELANLIKGKKVAFIGAGVSHKTLIREFVELGAHVTLCDQKKSVEDFGDYAATIKELGIDLSLGENYLDGFKGQDIICLLYTSPSPRDGLLSRMPSSA